MSKAEKFIQEHTKNCSNELCAVEDRFGKKVISYHEWLTPDQAKRAVEIAREETIKEVCEWIKYNNENGGCSFVGWENDLKKYLEGEL